MSHDRERTVESLGLVLRSRQWRLRRIDSHPIHWSGITQIPPSHPRHERDDRHSEEWRTVSRRSPDGRRRIKPNGFWLVSSDCQRAGTPRPAGRNYRQTLILRASREKSSANPIRIRVPSEAIFADEGTAFRGTDNPVCADAPFLVGA